MCRRGSAQLAGLLLAFGWVCTSGCGTLSIGWEWEGQSRVPLTRSTLHRLDGTYAYLESGVSCGDSTRARLSRGAAPGAQSGSPSDSALAVQKAAHMGPIRRYQSPDDSLKQSLDVSRRSTFFDVLGRVGRRTVRTDSLRLVTLADTASVLHVQVLGERQLSLTAARSGRVMERRLLTGRLNREGYFAVDRNHEIDAVAGPLLWSYSYHEALIGVKSDGTLLADGSFSFLVLIGPFPFGGNSGKTGCGAFPKRASYTQP